MVAVGAPVFLVQVPVPVAGPVAVGADGAELEDGFGALGAPPRSGDVHAVFDQVAAGAFDDAGGDGPAGGLGADGGGHLGGRAAEDGAGVPGDPAGGVRAGFGVKAPGGVPQVLGDVDEVDDDGDFDVPGGGFGLDAGDLVLVAVGERDPGLA